MKQKSGTEKIVDELILHRKLSINELAKKTKCKCIPARISEINLSKKKYKDYSIIRVGKWKESKYEIISKKTKSDDGINDIDKNSKRMISSTKRRTKKICSLVQTRDMKEKQLIAQKVSIANGELMQEMTLAMIPTSD